MAYRLLGGGIRDSWAARLAAKLRLYYLYRGLLAKLGYQNPFSAVLKITSKCNLSCSHCPWNFDVKEDLPTQRWMEIIDRVYSMGCVVVIFEGGEPTLRGDLGRLIDYVKSRGMLSIVITNGTTDIAGLSPDAFWFSVEGGETVHDRIRGRGTFKRAYGNITGNRDKYGVVLATISKTNVGELEEICRVFNPIADGIWFNFIYPYTEIADQPLSKEEAAAAAEEIIRLKRRYGRIINSSSYLKSVGRYMACYPWWTVNAMPDGTLTHGCTVEQIEECRCGECNLACYGEPYMALNLHLDALDYLKKISGVREKHILLHK